MGGRLLGKEQMPHVVNGKGLTLYSTLLWGEKAVETPKHNGCAKEKERQEKRTLRLQNFYMRKTSCCHRLVTGRKLQICLLINMKDGVILLVKPS